MNKINKIYGKTVPLAMNDVDTDLIIPAQNLTSVDKVGYRKNLFSRLKDQDPTFVLNQKKYAGARILISNKNFGCGSSREHAVWALQEAGFAVVIAQSFADIFFNNSAKNGLLLITLPEDAILKLLAVSLNNDHFIEVNLEEQVVTSSLHENFYFQIDAFQKHCFLNGLDELDYLLAHVDAIKTYEQAHQQKYRPTVRES